MKFSVVLLVIAFFSISSADSVDDLLRSGKYYEAERKLSETYGRDVESPEYLFLQGKTSFSGESSAARLKDYINKSTEDTYVPDWARLLLGKYYISLGLYVTARKQLGAIPIGSPFFSEAEYLAARCYLLSGEYEDALLAFGDIAAQSHHNDYLQWASLGAGDAYFENGDYNNAGEIYADLINNSSDDDIHALALLGLVDAFRARGDDRNAAKYYDIYENRYGAGISNPPDEPVPAKHLTAQTRQPETSVKGRYYIQVGAYSKKDNALRVADLYKESGYKVYMETFVENGNEFYRILVGGYNSKQQAKFIQKRLEDAAGEKYLLLTR